LQPAGYHEGIHEQRLPGCPFKLTLPDHLKSITYFTNSSRSIRWEKEKCLHRGKCLKSIPPIIDRPGVYSIPVTENQFEVLLSQSRFCPGSALVVEAS